MIALTKGNALGRYIGIGEKRLLLCGLLGSSLLRSLLRCLLLGGGLLSSLLRSLLSSHWDSRIVMGSGIALTEGNALGRRWLLRVALYLSLNPFADGYHLLYCGGFESGWETAVHGSRMFLFLNSFGETD